MAEVRVLKASDRKRKVFKDADLSFLFFFEMLACPFSVNEEATRLAFCYPLLSQIITAVILDVLCLRRSARMSTKEDSDIRLDFTKLDQQQSGEGGQESPCAERQNAEHTA